ncbi:hypothetical protein IHV25_05480 [Phaeovibrio sulfidiphilus]|uniref:Motility protein B-like N-terminal domain-containing protein n=1 Tax=Phaeovibrio sulfidiphilus TaxID=1220600 RepID=A0A8J7CW56_9PROT|nr:flagellar motor protein MotB [Phaeovibrio sulfidiphilus]MBE1237096.1 hypothetical protein [Phaeovibrio sulfidiphilus]
MTLLPDPLTSAPRNGPDQPRPRLADSIWMITITDLILLLFAFFVLLFAMMTTEVPLSPEASAVPAASDVLSTRVDAPLGIERTPARQERNIEAVLPPAAFETAYFGALLEDMLKDAPGLDGIVIRIYPDVITLKLPPGVWDARPANPGDPEPLSPLARFLDRLGKKVVVSGCRAPDPESALAWSRGLDDAAKTANNLKKAGFLAPVDIQSQLAASTSGEGVYLYILAEGEEP